MSKIITGHEAEMAALEEADAKFDTWYSSLTDEQRADYRDAIGAQSDAQLMDENGMCGGMFGTEPYPAKKLTDAHRSVLESRKTTLGY